MEKSNKLRHALVDGGECAEHTDVGVSPSVFEHKGSQMCLDGTYTLVEMKAERLHGIVWVSDGTLFGPRKKLISQMATIREPIHLFAITKHINLDSCL